MYANSIKKKWFLINEWVNLIEACMNIIMFDGYIDRTDEMINNYSSEKGHFIEFTLHNTCV